jgi:hypothetical protein
MLGIIGRRLQAVDIPHLTAMRAGHGSPIFFAGEPIHPNLDGCRGRRVISSDCDLVNQ